MKSKLTRVGASILLALGGIVGLAATTAAPAHADAKGCASWSGFMYKGWPIPGGFLCHRIFGSGKRIEYQDAAFSAHSSFCNWRIDFRYFDVTGRNYATSWGATHYECTGYGSRSRGAVTVPYYGRACAYLYSNGGYVTKQCHSI